MIGNLTDVLALEPTYEGLKLGPEALGVLVIKPALEPTYEGLKPSFKHEWAGLSC